MRIAGKNDLPGQPQPAQPAPQAAPATQAFPAPLANPAAPLTRAAPLARTPSATPAAQVAPPAQISSATSAAGAAPEGAPPKKGFLEGLLGFFGGGKKTETRPRLSPQASEEEEEVEELFEQMQGLPEEPPMKQGRGRKGGKGAKAVGQKAVAPPEPLQPPQPAAGMTYRERRRIERLRAQGRLSEDQNQAQAPAPAAAQAPAPARGAATAPPSGGQPAAAPPVDVQAKRLTRRQQRLAERDEQAQAPAGEQGRGAVQAPQAVSPVSQELAGLDVGDLLSSGKKKPKKKAKAAAPEELGEEGNEELSEAELGGEGLGELEGEEEGEEDLGELEEEGEGEGDAGKDGLLTRKCPRCKRQAKDTAFCPGCGAGMCDQCAPERVKLLDQVKWTCPGCRAQFKVKARKGAAAGEEF